MRKLLMALVVYFQYMLLRGRLDSFLIAASAVLCLYFALYMSNASNWPT